MRASRRNGNNIGQVSRDTSLTFCVVTPGDDSSVAERQVIRPATRDGGDVRQIGLVRPIDAIRII